MDGERLSELRKDKGLTQKELAKELGISENSISSYERNLTSPDDEIKIMFAKYFNVSLDYLLGLTNKQTPLEMVSSKLIYLENVPERANKDIDTFIDYLKKKYNL